MKGKRASKKKLYPHFLAYMGPGDKQKLLSLAKAEERSGSWLIRKWIHTAAEGLPK